MNAKETLKEIRTMLGFSDEEIKVEMATATLTDGTVITYEGELQSELPSSFKLLKVTFQHLMQLTKLKVDCW